MLAVRPYEINPSVDLKENALSTLTLRNNLLLKMVTTELAKSLVKDCLRDLKESPASLLTHSFK